MTENRFMKGDYNENHCEVWLDDEYIGDVRTSDANKFINLLNGLKEENSELKEAMKRMMIDMMSG